MNLNGDNGEYWKAIADPKPPEPLSEVLRKYMDAFDARADAVSRSVDRITRQKRQRRILDTPYPPRGEMFVDWCPVPKIVTPCEDDSRQTVPIITGHLSLNGGPVQLLHADVPLKRINWNDPDRGTLHHRYYGWEPKTKTLVLGPERIEACEHEVGRPVNVCPKCGFDLANARRRLNGLLSQSIGAGIAGGLSNAYQPPFKEWCGYGMYPTATESDPIEKTPKADPATCEHDWPQCGCPPNTSPIGECTKCGTPYLSWELRERFHRNMAQRRRNARKPRRGLLWRMRAIWDRWGWRYEECRTLFGSTPIHRYSLLRYLSLFHFPYTGEGSPLAGFGVFVRPFRIDFARWSLYFGRKTVSDRTCVEKFYGASIYHIPFQRVLSSVFLTIHYGHVNSLIGRDVKRQVFDLYLCGGETYGCHSLTRIIRRYTLRPIASAARWLWSLVPKPVPGKRWRSGWKHLSDEERETLFREFK